MNFPEENIINDLEFQLSESGEKLISYRVIDRQGISRAVVRDIYYDNDNQINLLIELADPNNQPVLRKLVNSQLRQLDLDNQLILTNLSHQQLEDLPIYQPLPGKLTEKSSLDDNREMNNGKPNLAEVQEAYQISLFEEKLRVNRRRQKVGEIIVRKKIETRMVQIPIRREKLIIERIGKNPEQLTEVIVAEGEVNGIKFGELASTNTIHSTKSSFVPMQTARDMLDALAGLTSAAKAKIRIEILSDCSEHQVEHQDICDRYSTK